MKTLASKSELLVHFRLAPSFVFGLNAVHGLVLVCILSLPLVVWAKVLACLLVLLQWIRVHRQLTKLRRITGLKLAGADCSVQVGGQIFNACEYNKPFVLSWLVILYWQFAGKRWAVPILPGSLDKQSFRQLRVELLADR